MGVKRQFSQQIKLIRDVPRRMTAPNQAQCFPPISLPTTPITTTTNIHELRRKKLSIEREIEALSRPGN